MHAPKYQVMAYMCACLHELHIYSSTYIGFVINHLVVSLLALLLAWLIKKYFPSPVKFRGWTFQGSLIIVMIKYTWDSRRWQCSVICIWMASIVPLKLVCWSKFLLVNLSTTIIYTYGWLYCSQCIHNCRYKLYLLSLQLVTVDHLPMLALYLPN